MAGEAPGARAVLVTGASGFVGRHLTRDFAARGWSVRGLVRPGAAALEPGVEPAPAADLLDRDAVRRACAGVDTVVHLAARVHVMRDTAADPLAEFRRTNVEGTRVLIEAAAAAGVRRVLFASSVKAVGEATPDGCWGDDVGARPIDPYGVSKLEAEEVVRASGAGATILRLPLVYGIGVKGNMRTLFAAVRRGLPLPLGAVRNRRSLLYTGNLAAAVHAVLAAPAAAGETFFVSDDHDLSTPELVRQIARALGRPARLLPVPPSLFRAAGAVGDMVGRVAPFPLGSGAVERLLGSLCLDVSRLRAVAGYRPPFTPAEGLREMATGGAP
jgi:nucleoside-diphosphate-sugar epimerase